MTIRSKRKLSGLKSLAYGLSRDINAVQMVFVYHGITGLLRDMLTELKASNAKCIEGQVLNFLEER